MAFNHLSGREILSNLGGLHVQQRHKDFETYVNDVINPMWEKNDVVNQIVRNREAKITININRKQSPEMKQFIERRQFMAHTLVIDPKDVPNFLNLFVKDNYMFDEFCEAYNYKAAVALNNMEFMYPKLGVEQPIFSMEIVLTITPAKEEETAYM